MSDFTAFKQSFKGDLITPADPDYPEAITRWAINSARKAQVVAFVKDVGDVQAAIAYARQTRLPLAVRGGGHNAAGSSSVDGGLVIDLSRYLNNVRVDAEKKLGYIQGGALWKTVDEAAIEHGLATVGGTVNHTGVGGLILGGGYGWLSGQYGLAIDNLEEVTIVTANGSVLKANSSENSDLFWAVRGGGSNFGVVTEFVMRLHPQRRTVFAGMVIYPPSVREALVSRINAWRNKGSSEKEGVFAVFTRGPDQQPCIVLVLFYNGSEAEGRANFKQFFDLKPVVDDVHEIPYEQLNTVQNAIAAPGRNVYLKGTLCTGSAIEDMSAGLFDRVVALSADPQYAIALIFEYTPLQKTNSVAPDVTPYRRNLQNNIMVTVNWLDDTPEKSAYARNAAWELTRLVGKVDEAYGNYNPDSASLTSGSDTIDKTQALYGEHYPKMRAIKRKYDPEMIFNKWFAIKPATD